MLTIYDRELEKTMTITTKIMDQVKDKMVIIKQSETENICIV